MTRLSVYAYLKADSVADAAERLAQHGRDTGVTVEVDRTYALADSYTLEQLDEIALLEMRDHFASSALSLPGSGAHNYRVRCLVQL